MTDDGMLNEANGMDEARVYALAIGWQLGHGSMMLEYDCTWA